MIRNYFSSRFTAPASQTTSSLCKHCILSSHSETDPKCDNLIERLSKQCKLAYHNLKKVIRGRHEYISVLPYKHLKCTTDHHDVISSPSKKNKLTYHNLLLDPICDHHIESLRKKCKLTYHNLKKVIRGRYEYISALPSKHMKCTIDHHDVIAIPSKKYKLTYHNLKKVVRAKHYRIYTLPTEHKHQSINDKYHHDLQHQHGEEAMLLTHISSIFNMPCPQVRLVSSDIHKLTYHMLKKTYVKETNATTYPKVVLILT